MSVQERRQRALGRGKALAAARRTAGLSQAELALRIGTAKSTIARVESGTMAPSLELALLVARELGESVEQVFGGER